MKREEVVKRAEMEKAEYIMFTDDVLNPRIPEYAYRAVALLKMMQDMGMSTFMVKGDNFTVVEAKKLADNWETKMENQFPIMICPREGHKPESWTGPIIF